MSKHEFALIILTIGFAILALLFLISFIARRTKTSFDGVSLILISIFLIFTVLSIYFGFAYYKDANLCKKCGEKATYSSGFGKYCDDCFEEDFHITCCRCGKEASSYVSKGKKTYCHSCATIEFGYGYGN